MDTTTAANLTTDQLHAAIRYAGWKPAELRQNADDLEAGTHEVQAALESVPGLVNGLPQAWRDEAARIAQEGQAAEAELAERRKKAPAFRGYVS